MLKTEVLIIGAGPAGATAALNLAPFRSVLLVDRQAQPAPRIGESLIPATRRLLADMALFDSFLQQGYAPCYGNRAVWGGADAVEMDFLRDPDGHGWHVDRCRFEAWLRDAAAQRGAGLLAPAEIQSVERHGQGWNVEIRSAGKCLQVSTDFIIDAGGRSAPAARRLGARRRVHDRLVCAWLYGADTVPSPAALTHVEAVENGWWYTAPLPGRRRVLAFHTDADLLAARAFRNREDLLRHAAATVEIGPLVAHTDFSSGLQAGFTVAHSAALEQWCGDRWVAAGDAAMSFDPLSSQGLFNALFTGLAAAEAADRSLSGSHEAMTEYNKTVACVFHAYQKHLGFWYGMEQRWPNAEFWKRRHMTAELRQREFA